MGDFQLQANQQAKKHRFLLSIDGGGGMRGLSPLFIIKEILYRIQMKRQLENMPLACDVFDLAGGTGTGGLIVIMLFRLRMDIETAIRAYRELTEKVTSAKGKGPVKPVQAVRSSRLKEQFLKVMKKHLRLEADSVAREMRMLKEDPNSMAFVCASLKQMTMNPELLRTWSPKKFAICDCTIVNAVMATCAEKPFFEEVVFKDDYGITKTYIRTDPLWDDPLRWVLREGRVQFLSDVSCVVSVGTGLGTRDGDSEGTGIAGSHAIEASMNTHHLIRLDVDNGLQDLPETKRSLGDIQMWTMQYLGIDTLGDKEVDNVVQKYLTLKGVGTVTIPN